MQSFVESKVSLADGICEVFGCKVLLHSSVASIKYDRRRWGHWGRLARIDLEYPTEKFVPAVFAGVFAKDSRITAGATNYRWSSVRALSRQVSTQKGLPFFVNSCIQLYFYILPISFFDSLVTRKSTCHTRWINIAFNTKFFREVNKLKPWFSGDPRLSKAKL